MKKTTFTFTLALTILLTGCDSATAPSPSPSPPATPVPSLFAAPTSSPTPEPTLSLPDPISPDCPPLWISIPTEGFPSKEEKPRVEEGNVLWRVFYHAPELDATLYDVTYTDEILDHIYTQPAFGDRNGYGAQFVLQAGEYFGEVFRSGYWSDQLGCLTGGDYDGDGEIEYVVGRHRDFFLCKPNKDSAWNTYSYSDEDFGRDAFPLLTVEQTGRSITVYCGASSASYHMGDGIPGKISLFPLDFSQMPLWFEFSDNSIWATASLMTVGEDGGPDIIFGHLRGKLVLEDETFTLTALRAVGFEGV